MGREKKVFVVGEQGDIQKTLMVFSFSDKHIVWSWSEPRITIDGRNDAVDIHRTYHDSGEITFSTRIRRHIHHSAPITHEPLSQFKGPVLFGVAYVHYLDFEGFRIKRFDPRRVFAERIVLDLEGGNYLGLKVSAILLNRDSDGESTIHFKKDNEEVWLIRKVNPWLKLVVRRLDGIELAEEGFRIA